MTTNQQIKRITEELKATGLSQHALKKGESKKLYELIHPDEHVHAAVLGRKDVVNNAMLVATDRKVIFIQYSLLFMNTDEITYDIVSGVSLGHQGLANKLTLHTRIGDFVLSFVSLPSARKFISYIEKRRLEGDGDNQSITSTSSNPLKPFKSTSSAKFVGFSNEEKAFLAEHQLGVLSTIDFEGRPSGAAIYFMLGNDGLIYMLTKELTSKAQHIFRNQHVSLTVTDEEELATIQIDAVAFVEQQPDKRLAVFNHITQQRNYKKGASIPPITKIDAGAYVAIRFEPYSVKFSNFAKK